MTSLLWPTMQRYQCPQRKKEICAQRHTQGECHVKTQRHAEGSQSCEDGGREWNYAANPQPYLELSKAGVGKEGSSPRVFRRSMADTLISDF